MVYPSNCVGDSEQTCQLQFGMHPASGGLSSRAKESEPTAFQALTTGRLNCSFTQRLST